MAEKKVLTLDSETILVSFKGVEYELAPLKLKHQDLASQLSSENAEEVLEAMYELLKESGMPKEVAQEIAVNKITQLVEALVEVSQKKS